LTSDKEEKQGKFIKIFKANPHRGPRTMALAKACIDPPERLENPLFFIGNNPDFSSDLRNIANVA
jgi:hypothetical protein